MEQNFKKGIKDGLPICLGYLSVSFTFGLLAVGMGLRWWQATLISLTNVTSAGQFAGLTIMMEAGPLISLIISQFFINLRYLLMSISLSQKVDERFTGIHRAILSMGVTDEIFAVAMSQEKPVSRQYFTGLFLTPYLGWGMGTLLGALLGEIVPAGVAELFGIAIYGMFLAIIIPKARDSKPVLSVVVIAIVLSCIIYYVPQIKLSSGMSITLCAVVAAAYGAWRHPIAEEENNEGGAA
ncbi:MAG: AzlC family ABC transporter permease [bacterium]|nr:AzlC family ABC transporter permease [bacterium]